VLGIDAWVHLNRRVYKRDERRDRDLYSEIGTDFRAQKASADSN